MLSRIVHRLRHLLQRRASERAMDDEMRFHVEMEAAELERAGLDRDAAMRQARIAFGGLERFKEEGRDARGTRWLQDLSHDVTYALRQARATPGFSAATVLTLTLAIGATTMMSTSHRYLMSQGRSVAGAEQLVYIGQGARDCISCRSLAVANFLAVREQAKSFERIALFEEWEPILRGPDRAELTDGVLTTPGLFETLRIRPLLGRTLIASDTLAGANPVIVISETMWRVRFGVDADMLGRTLFLDRKPYEVVGVIADRDVYPLDTELWAPLQLRDLPLTDRMADAYLALARLRQGRTADQARAEIGMIGSQLASAFPEQMRDLRFTLTPLLDFNRPSSNVEGWIFTGAVALVLLIGCINLAGLLIARLSGRRRELAIRRALGAGPGRLVRQLVVEVTVLTLIAGVLGALLAIWGIQTLVRWPGIRVDTQSFGLALSIGAACGLVISVWPAWRLTRPTLVGELRETTRTATGGTDAARGRRILVIAEVAFSIVLLSAAGLFTRSLSQLRAIEPGFDTTRLLTMRLAVPQGSTARNSDIQELVASIEAIPGVQRAGVGLQVPYGVGSARREFAIEGRTMPDQRPRARMNAASPRYFEAMGIPVLRGRAFSVADRVGTQRVALINQSAAEQFFAGRDPVGSRVVIDSVSWEIVGLVGTVFNGDPEEVKPVEIYRSTQQWPRLALWIAVRTLGEPTAVVAPVRDAVRRFDADLAITRMLTMDALRETSTEAERRMLRIMTSFAIGAILISAIGLYGLISYSVAQRRREFGVRLALGAQRRTVLRHVLAQGLRLAVIGNVVGVALAIAVLRVMQFMIFGISTTDPLTLIVVVTLVSGIAVLAALIPAQRAMRVDPMTSLRAD
ncbi:MAG: ABC transporter permease [Gemmatimonadota bacterium]